MDKIRKVEFTIDNNNPLNGVKTISLVEQPAIESDFVYFNKPTTFIELKSETYKQVVLGLALIPEKYILRFDGLGEPYYGYFSQNTIEQIRNKFHKELLTSQVNTDHNSNYYIDAYLIESFIIDSPERLADVHGKGVAEATIGSWMVAYKIEDPQTFQRVLSGELRGFSVEVFLQQFCKTDNNNNKNLDTVMNKILEKFKALLSEMEGEQKAPAVEEKKLDKGADPKGVTYEYGSVGEPVNVVAQDGSLQPAPDGVYSLDSGYDVTVASGVATDIQPTKQEQKKEEPKPAVVDNSAELEKVKKELETLKNDFSKATNDLKTSKEEIEKLKKTPITNPLTKAEVKVEKVDFSKLSNADKFRAKYGKN